MPALRGKGCSAKRCKTRLGRRKYSLWILPSYLGGTLRFPNWRRLGVVFGTQLLGDLYLFL